MADYTWARRAGRFRSVESGRFVPESEIRDGVDALVRLSASRMADLSRQFRAGQITASQWLTGQLAEIKAVHLAAALAAKGGRSQMTPADYGRVGQQIRVQYQYARQMVADAISGKARLNGRLDARASQYANAARVGFEQARRRVAQEAGALRERNVINSSESCAGCRAQTARGLVPLGMLVPIGARSPCGPRCACSIVYEGQAVEVLAS